MFLAGPEIRLRYASNAVASDLAAAIFVLPVEDSQVSLACDCEAVTHAIVIDVCRLSVRLSVKRVDCDKTKAPSKKSSIMTNSKSPIIFPMSLR